MFNNSKRLNSVESRILTLESKITELYKLVELQEVLNTDMRNKVLRKIQTKKPEQILDYGTLRPGQTVKLEGENDGSIQK